MEQILDLMREKNWTREQGRAYLRFRRMGLDHEKAMERMEAKP